MSEHNPHPDEALDTGAFHRGVDERFEHRLALNVPGRHNDKLRRVIEWVNEDEDLYGLWIAANVNAMERLGMTDHGPVHVKIVMNLAVRMLRLLVDAGVQPSVVQYEMDPQDAEVVVALAALLHDVGLSIHRADHEAFSLFVAQDKLWQILPELYEPRRATILRAEILHAIISHRSGGKPLTLEAGVVREPRPGQPARRGLPHLHLVLEPGQPQPLRRRPRYGQRAVSNSLRRGFPVHPLRLGRRHRRSLARRR